MSSFSMQNGRLVPSIANGALTVAIQRGNQANDPIIIETQRADGIVEFVQVDEGTSVTLSLGSTMGVPVNTPFRLWFVGVFAVGGGMRLGVTNCRGIQKIFPLCEFEARSSVAEGGAGGADSAGVIYSDVGVSDDDVDETHRIAILGFMTWDGGLVTAGDWNALPDHNVHWNAGIPLPGDLIQSVGYSTQGNTDPANTHNNTTAFVPSHITADITLRSPANGVGYAWNANAGTTFSGDGCDCVLLRGGQQIGAVSRAYASNGVMYGGTGARGMDFPGAIGPHTYAVGLASLASHDVVVTWGDLELAEVML